MSLKAIPCSLRKANDFVALHHRHSQRTARNGGKFAVAAVSSGLVVAVAIVGNPLSATYMDGFTAEVLRSCCLPSAPKNCNSFLYGVCRRIWFAMGGSKILTYTLQTESGVSLKAAGWEKVAEVKGHDAATWGKNDHLTRSNQAVFTFAKFRWEAVNARSTASVINWTACDIPTALSAVEAAPEVTP